MAIAANWGRHAPRVIHGPTEDGDHQQLIAEGGLYAKLYGHLQH